MLAIVGTTTVYFGFAVLLLKNIPYTRGSWIARVLADDQHVNLGSYIAFSIALVLLLNRYWVIRSQFHWIDSDRLLPREHRLVLREDGLELRRQLKDILPIQHRAIPIQLLDAGLQQSRVAWSPSTVSDAIKTRTETIQGQVDAEYGIIKYMIWAIPSIGFCGTVYGLGAAIGSMRDIPGMEISDDQKMQNAIGSLFTAFDTTLIALLLSLVLMFVYHVVQAREDSFIVNSMDWCIRRFALRMHDSQGER